MAVLLAMSAMPMPALHAQAADETYTVVAGDSLSAIAQRYGLTVDDLAAFNQIQDPSRIQVGQVLQIPTPDALARAALAATTAGHAQPGETLTTFARRTGLEVEQLAALNGMEAGQRLFPGQPVYVPDAQAPDEPLRFGAITAVEFSERVVQGKTGTLVIQASRPILLDAALGDVPLALTSSVDDPTRYVAYLPAPALWDPGAYPLTVSYWAGDGFPASRTWPITVIDGGYASQQIVVPDEKGELLDPAIVAVEETRVNEVWGLITPDNRWTAVVARPIADEYPTTSPFGSRRAYVGGGFSSTGYHAGQDFAAPEDVVVAAPAPGVIALAEPMAVRGNAVIIDHGSGVLTGYWHLSEIFVAAGDIVDTGDPLGLVGTTGRSTGPHLHWELRIYGVAVDPMQFLAGGG